MGSYILIQEQADNQNETKQEGKNNSNNQWTVIWQSAKRKSYMCIAFTRFKQNKQTAESPRTARALGCSWREYCPTNVALGLQQYHFQDKTSTNQSVRAERLQRPRLRIMYIRVCIHICIFVRERERDDCCS